MKLGAKLRYLREVEGTLRGLGREMTQQEVVRRLKAETGQPSASPTFRRSRAGAGRI